MVARAPTSLLLALLAALAAIALATSDDACVAEFEGNTEHFDGCELDLTPTLRVYYRVVAGGRVLETLLHGNPPAGGFIGWGWFSDMMIGTTAVVAYRRTDGQSAVVRNYFLGAKNSEAVVPTNSILLANSSTIDTDGALSVMFRQSLASLGQTSAVWSVGPSADVETGVLQYHGPTRGIVSVDLVMPEEDASLMTEAPATTTATMESVSTDATTTTVVNTPETTTVMATTTASLPETDPTTSTTLPIDPAVTPDVGATDMPTTAVAGTTPMADTPMAPRAMPTEVPDSTPGAMPDVIAGSPPEAGCTAQFGGRTLTFAGCDEVSPSLRVYFSVLPGDKTLQTLLVGTPPAGGYIAWGWFSAQMSGTTAAVAYERDGEAQIATYFTNGKRSDLVVRNDSNPLLMSEGELSEDGSISALFTQNLPALGDTPAVWSFGPGRMGDDGAFVLGYHGSANRGVARFNLVSSGVADVVEPLPESSAEPVADPMVGTGETDGGNGGEEAGGDNGTEDDDMSTDGETEGTGDNMTGMDGEGEYEDGEKGDAENTMMNTGGGQQGMGGDEGDMAGETSGMGEEKMNTGDEEKDMGGDKEGMDGDYPEW